MTTALRGEEVTSDKPVEQPVGSVKAHLTGQQSLKETLAQIVEAATAGLGADMAGLTLLDDDGIGALNLYARPQNEFDAIDEDLGMAFAAQAAAAVLGECDTYRTAAGSDGFACRDRAGEGRDHGHRGLHA